MKMRTVLGMIAVLAIANMSFGALAQTLMSEDFEGFAASTSLGAQDSSWSVYNGGANTVYDLSYTTAPDWPLPTMGAFLGGVFPSGTSYTVNTKTLTGAQVPTENNVEFDMSFYANSWNLYHGGQTYVTLAKADGTPIVQFANYRYADVTYMQLNNVDIDPVADFVPFAISLDFATQKATIAVSGVDQGIEVAFLASAVPGDLAKIDFQDGGYYSGTNKTFVMWIDNLQLSQTPEPATMSLLLLGGLGLLRRKH